MQRTPYLFACCAFLIARCIGQETSCASEPTFNVAPGSENTFTIPVASQCTDVTVSFANGSDSVFYPYEAMNCSSQDPSEQSFILSLDGDTPQGDTTLVFHCDDTLYCLIMNVTGAQGSATSDTGVVAGCSIYASQSSISTTAASTGFFSDNSILAPSAASATDNRVPGDKSPSVGGNVGNNSYTASSPYRSTAPWATGAGANASLQALPAQGSHNRSGAVATTAPSGSDLSQLRGASITTEALTNQPPSSSSGPGSENGSTTIQPDSADQSIVSQNQKNPAETQSTVSASQSTSTLGQSDNNPSSSATSTDISETTFPTSSAATSAGTSGTNFSTSSASVSATTSAFTNDSTSAIGLPLGDEQANSTSTSAPLDMSTCACYPQST